MLIATICGSLQPASANGAVLAVMEGAVRQQGHEIRRVDGLDTLPPFRPDVESPGPVAAWSTSVSGADAVLISSPEYAAGPPGALKNALDWAVGLSTLYRTPVGLVCAGSTGGAFTIEALVRTLSYQGALTVATLGIAAVRTKLGPSGDITDPATASAVATVVDRVLRAVGADEPTLLSMVSEVVGAHGVDPARFGLSPG